MLYGYCRISTGKQSIDRQIRNIKATYPEAIIVEEVYTGTKFQGRDKLEKMVKAVKEGDTIVFDSVSRMSRNAEECPEVEIGVLNNNITRRAGSDIIQGKSYFQNFDNPRRLYIEYLIS